MKTVFNGEEFGKALTEEPLRAPIVLTGMVKKPENSHALPFSPGTSCSQWTSIPVEMIDNVEWLGKVSCQDHTHDLVRLRMKDEVSSNAEALMALLRSYVTMPVQSSPNLPARPVIQHPLEQIPAELRAQDIIQQNYDLSWWFSMLVV